MNTKAKTRLYFLFVVTVIMCLITACYFEESKNPMYVQNEHFIIDSNSILESINNGNKDVFIPADISSKIGSSPSNGPVDWTQTDYLSTADALHKFVWGESLDNWKLNSMIFRAPCNEAQIGLQDAHFVFFNILNSNDSASRIVHDLVINPKDNSIDVWATKYSPIVMKWEFIDLTNIKVSADAALQIAEVNGGMDKRKVNNNACYISIAMSIGLADYNGWRVKYYENPGVLFNLQIDPITGSIK